MTLLTLAIASVEVEATVLDGSAGRVAYAWRDNAGDPLTIRDLLVLHDCDHAVQLARLDRIESEHPGTTRPDAVRPFIGWTMTGVGAHDLIAVEPLHIEASVYWPDCCGLHGFIRDGRWVPA